MKPAADAPLCGDISSILRSVMEGIADRISDPVVRDSVITVADSALLGQRPSAAILPENLRRETIGIVLDGMITRMGSPEMNSGETA